MATSGNTFYTLNRDQLITAAMRKLSVLAKGQTPDAEDITNGAMALNTLIAEFRALGMPIWARNDYSFVPTVGNSSYTIGVGRTLNTPYPLHLLQAFRMDAGGTALIPIEIIPDYNFNTLPSTPGGSAVNMTYQALSGYGVVQIWPTPTVAAATTITLVYQRPFEYFDTAVNSMDLPEEWYNPLIYRLAVDLAPEWGISLPDRQQLKSEAADHLSLVLGMGQEDASFYVQPRMR
jgi:hypothetical protein